MIEGNLVEELGVRCYRYGIQYILVTTALGKGSLPTMSSLVYLYGER